MRARKSISAAGLLRAASRNCAVRSVGDRDCAATATQQAAANTGAMILLNEDMQSPKPRCETGILQENREEGYLRLSCCGERREILHPLSRVQDDERERTGQCGVERAITAWQRHLRASSLQRRRGLRRAGSSPIALKTKNARSCNARAITE